MHTQPEGFVAETVDEQIEQFALIGRDQKAAPEACVVQDLQGLYVQVDSPEQVRRSLDNIWARLADEVSPVNQTMFSAPDAGSLRVLPGGGLASDPATIPPLTLIDGQLAANKQMGKQNHASRNAISLPARPRSKKQSLRRTLALSALAAVVLLSVFSWSMVTHLASHPSTIIGSGPGTAMPTIPATPAPQSLRSQVQSLLTQFHQEVTDWGQAHQYHDTYNNTNYSLDYEYGQQGIGGVLDHMVQNAYSSADFQAALNLIQNELTNLHAMETGYTDQKPANQAHATDISLLNHYQLKSGLVIVVSLLEQQMRVYQDGQLIKSFSITTGRYETPTLPGSWQIFLRQTKVALKSPYPKGSPHWYPSTQINYALGFHSGGYLINDSWWRMNYGPGTNFPHYDVGGAEAFSGSGSQGGVEMSLSNMAWLYNIAQVNTPVVIY